MLESSDGAHFAREAAASANVRIRPLESLEDCNDCVDLQREVWGFAQPDIVPASLLHVVDYVGGIAAGAFDADGTLLGFVFGITGIHEGELAHWSHMLGVCESARNMGVGRMLKEHQRRALVMTTFPRSGDRTLAAGDERPPIVLLEIPADILDNMSGLPLLQRRVACRCANTSNGRSSTRTLHEACTGTRRVGVPSTSWCATPERGLTNPEYRAMAAARGAGRAAKPSRAPE